MSDPHPSSRPPLPELLAPAGDWECVRAAVENGADAVYFGLSRFNARMRAQNFIEADLPSLMEFLHLRGVRGYVTFNTLVFENELAEAEDYLRAVISAGVDAAIVQDVGICRLIRRLSPDFPIHASTQMTVTSAAGVELARELGCQLVVLARECSIAEITRIRAAAAAPDAPRDPLPLEVFVHGALCVAYSGQCLTSEALGGRSANRGECAQACRLPYDLISDGRPVPLGDRRYLLSPQDLAGLEVLPELVQSGVASLKIEGRLKSPEYVANITRVYRHALDRVAGGGQGGPPRPAAGSADWYDLEMGFSRGLFTGWFRGIDNQRLVHARFGKKRGVYLGSVVRCQGDAVLLRLEAPIKPGDGVVFDAGTPDQPEEGGRVYQVDPGPSSLPGVSSLRFGRDAVEFRKVLPGHRVWKTSDPELDRRVRQSFAGESPHRRRPIRVEVHGSAGEPLTVVARDELGHVVEVPSSLPLTPALQRPLTPEVLSAQLGRLGGTPFELGGLESRLPDGLILPVSELNRIRRDLVSRLETLRRQPRRWTLHEAAPAAAPSAKGPGHPSGAGEVPPRLVVLVRSLPQLEAALACGVTTVYCEFEDPKRYREAVARFREAHPPGSDSRIYVAPPRVFKPGEEWILAQVRSSNPDGYLVRNADHLQAFAADPRIGDFSLNVANSWTASYFRERFGLEVLTPSYDLNFDQLTALLQAVPAGWFEVTVHQHMPMFHMEHCVFCAFLSKGKDYHDCGRPCDRHDVRLRDRVGQEHPLKADAGCRNTLYNARAQTGAEYVARMLELGVRRFRIEFLNEDPEEVTRTLHLYDQLLRGEIAGGDLWRRLRLQHQLGVTRGQMERSG
ncbi:MAG TPA: peptidase U32 [Verrucomicrobiales bacterium]|nr:peptidase U32 [Verrucomicrobiales bacterium]